MQTFPSIPGLYYVSEDHIRFVLRLYCVSAVVSTSLLSTYCILVRSRPLYDFFEHVQNSPTSTKTIKVASRSYRFLLHFSYVVQVCTASNRFYTDVVGTWSSVHIQAIQCFQCIEFAATCVCLTRYSFYPLSYL